jgi:hypothetical protein
MHLKITNGTPAKYTLGQLRRDNPQTSFPKLIPDELLASYDVYPYTRPTPSEYDTLAWRLIDDEFVNVNGAWMLPYKLEALPLEQAQQNIRSRRDSLLADTDWLVIKAYERSENIPAEWELYRQALRDITEQTGFPYEVQWPTKP